LVANGKCQIGRGNEACNVKISDLRIKNEDLRRQWQMPDGNWQLAGGK